MNKLVFYIIIMIVISSTIFSCSSEDKKSERYISNQINKLIPTLDKCYKKIVVLPEQGCAGCITVAEFFFKNNYKNTDILFILTNVSSIKIISHKLGVDVRNLSNIYIDENNIFSCYKNPIYPIVIFYNCNEQKLEKLSIQKPGNDAFKNM